jgi:hypothetical protein
VNLGTLVDDMVRIAMDNPGIDLLRFRNIMETTSTIVNVFLGFAFYLLAIGVPVIVAIELLICNFQPLSHALIEREETREEAGTEKKNRNWGLFVHDARKAIRMAAATGVNVNLCYFKCKWRTLAVLSFTINVVIFGGERIVRWVTSLVSGIIIYFNLV